MTADRSISRDWELLNAPTRGCIIRVRFSILHDDAKRPKRYEVQMVSGELPPKDHLDLWSVDVVDDCFKDSDAPSGQITCFAVRVVRCF